MSAALARSLREPEVPSEIPSEIPSPILSAPLSPEPPMPPTPSPRDRALAAIAAEPGLSQSQLGARIGLSQSPCSTLCRALEAEGLIERRRATQGAYWTQTLYLRAPGAAQQPPPAETPWAPAGEEGAGPLPLPGPEGEEPGGDCEGAVGDLAADRAEDLERQLRERTAERDAARAEVAGAWVALETTGAPGALPGAIADRAAVWATWLESQGEEVRRRQAILSALGLPWTSGPEEVAAWRRGRETAPSVPGEPCWVETAPGSWDLRALRPVSIAEIEREASGWSWSIPDPSDPAEVLESGRTRTLERARWRAAQAADEAIRDQNS